MSRFDAEHMFTPNLDTYTGDDAIIDTFTREDSARATRARASTADKLAFDQKMSGKKEQTFQSKMLRF